MVLIAIVDVKMDMNVHVSMMNAAVIVMNVLAMIVGMMMKDVLDHVLDVQVVEDWILKQ